MVCHIVVQIYVVVDSEYIVNPAVLGLSTIGPTTDVLTFLTGT